MNDVTLFRLYLLKALYLMVAVGLGLVVWPGVIHHTRPWELMEGVVQCMLASFGLLSALGLRYPLQMLPVLLWEMAWKTIWLLVVAMPLWLSGRMDQATWAMASDVLVVVIFPFVVPWSYLFKNYVSKSGDRWSRTTVAS
ncbi:hypothetical protein [Rugamonas sp.]|uniref:hypothetical protein n=1 Tax=Rugamonas sp. TaxID=1926287 RepID=UPI0025E1526A|nr:hypothetical protein [Rugamonas sp.]